MKLFNVKKADGGITAIIIIVIILVFLGWLINVGSRECKTNTDCGKEAYCGSDFACHQIPIIEKSPVVVERNYIMPALIIGIAMIISVFIFKWDSLKRHRSKEVEKSPSSNASDYSASRLKSP